MSSCPIPSDLFEVVSGVLTDQRRSRLQTVAEKRLPWLRCVLQDVHGIHNISACMRSCEALGVGDVDIVSLQSRDSTTAEPCFRPSSVGCGIKHWLNIRQFNSLDSYHSFLSPKNFKLFAALPDRGERHETTEQNLEPPLSPPHLSITELVRQTLNDGDCIAIVFGNEHNGVHPDWHSLIDGSFSIDTTGFTESLNVSVAVAITCHHLICEAKRVFNGSSHMYLNSTQITTQLNIWITKILPHWQSLYNQYSHTKHSTQNL